MGIKLGPPPGSSLFTKKDLEHKLHIQHKNTRHDAVDIILAYQAEIDKFNDNFWRNECCTKGIFDPSGTLIQRVTYNQHKYDNGKKKMEADELTRRIHNLKQRKPKDGE